MVTIDEVITFQRRDGIIESEAVVTAADGETIHSGELGLGTISRIKSVQPLEADKVAGAAIIDSPGYLNNSVALTLYLVESGGTLSSPTGSVKLMITAQQV